MTRTLLILGLAILGFSACERGLQNPDLPQDIRILNHWIWENMNVFYLWEDQLPYLDPDYQEDPEAYFYDLIVAQDRFSRIYQDYDEIQDAVDGVETTTGISALPALYFDSILVYLVEFVYEDTPADLAGVIRGDIISSIDGQKLTKDNYLDLYYQETATFDFSDWTGEEFVPNGKQVSLTAQREELNPVVYSDVIESGGTRTGYLVYAQFTYGKEDIWLEELNGVLSGFKDAGITDLVVDLRYNPGGYSSMAAYLASCIAPASVSQQGEVFTLKYWNDGYTDFWKDQDLDDNGQKDGDESAALVERFPGSQIQLDMDKVYFLTARGTASASELLMTSLYPYMDVIQIGETTVGKCYASIILDDDEDPKRHNWAIMPLVMKYANAQGFTDFVDGIDPDVEVRDNLLYAVPFGDLSDPLLATALEEISGVSPSLKRSGPPEVNYKGLYRPEFQLPNIEPGLLPSL